MTVLANGSAADGTPLRQVLLVSADQALYGIPLEQCREILDPQPYTPLPGTGALVCGLINLRGRLVTVFDLGACLGVTRAAGRADHGVVVLDFEGRQLGLAVEAVVGVEAAHEPCASERDEALRPVVLPAAESSAETVCHRAFALLDADAIFQPAFTPADSSPSPVSLEAR